jgi:hypothetical protein
MTYSKEQAYAYTLCWVNERRAKHGLELLRGFRVGDCLGGSCPLFHALKDTGVTWVGMTRATTGDSHLPSAEWDIELPMYAMEFISLHAQNAYRLQETA